MKVARALKGVAFSVTTILLLSSCGPSTLSNDETPESTTYIPIITISPNATTNAPTKKDNSQEIEKYKQKLEFTYDDIDEITWIYARGQKKEISDFTCYVYIGQDKTHSWLRFKLGFHRDSWIFMNSVKLKSGNNLFEYVLKSGDRESNVSRGIYEWFDILLTDAMATNLRRVCGDAETKVRCRGDTYYEDFTLTKDQKKNINIILDYYDLITG